VGFPRQAGVAIVLVTATLWLQSAGMAVLIHWARVSIDRGVKALSEWHSCLLMIRFTTVMIVSHILHILLWVRFTVGVVFHRGNPASISLPPVTPRLAMATLCCHDSGGC